MSYSFDTADVLDAAEMLKSMGFDSEAKSIASLVAAWHKNDNQSLRDKVAAYERLSVWLYNQGYMAGHEDTVEGRATHIVSGDEYTYHDDVVADLNINAALKQLEKDDV